MWYTNFNKNHCRSCYACVRVCPVNAIKVKNGQAQIMEERCIVCGECSKVCPQKNKLIKSELSKVKQYIKSDSKVVASVAPSFSSIFGNDSKKIPKLLRRLGFDYIEETVVSIDPIIEKYKIYANKDDKNNYITSFCPAMNNLIQKHYPLIKENLIPVISPFIYHGRILKKKYGEDAKVVFIGPCLAKKAEAYYENSVDAVITFGELKKWIKSSNVKLESLSEEDFDETYKEKLLVSIVGETSNFIKDNYTKKEIIAVDGIEDSIKILDAIQDKRFTNTLFELNVCRHGCLGGSGMPTDGVTYYERKINLINYAKSIKEKNYDYSKPSTEILEYKINLDKEFENLSCPLKEPNESEIMQILNSMGKNKKSDELNCGVCGYSTCREKAVAVYNKIAEVDMCLPFMRQKAENLSDVIFDSTPNLIGLIDENLDIIQFNPAAEKFFSIQRGFSKGMPIIMYLDEDTFKNVKDKKTNIIREKITLENNRTLIQTIIWLEENNVIIWIADDITKDENIEKKLQKMKVDSINMAQEVINKQMMVAQEIASLLGETTAETKVTLTKLKKLILEKEGIN
ncbi:MULTISPECIES: [Fe-Fe] hydrogenase large subunit C-terminal domain-containing protein [unclassified Romboutsia]|uniref:[Fe-Fe] hydrogenase large subunit C-terminal domain-containing protein n=1 Tax=unclassified Romboutsia TaxID=2626894 RepID=UPI00082197B2|nr:MULTISPECIES: [Fe-Fe] hydrogenase large subunit C-terminal domain-containing protein [unclassified Romboutsia]SCH75114.1 Iron hydrogenase 1 [uncultured Clostridium sp.]